MRFASPSLYSVCSGETPPGTMWRVGWAVAECSGAGIHHCERALIPSLPHLKDSSGCGLWCAVCAVCAQCALCARVCLSVTLRFES